MLRKIFRSKKGQGLVEYGLIIAGVALICAAAVSVFGHKTSDLISAVGAVLPGSHAGDNAPVQSGALIETTEAAAAGDVIELDTAAIVTATATGRLGNNVLGTGTAEGFGGLVLEAP